MNTAVVVALITGGFSVIVALIEWTRRSNNKDHASNSSKLDLLTDLVKEHLKGHP